ncbi:hypothetical protein BGW42_000741 [Actinomortierella wolfii]|nr:hypothetical protein BGW42_000741 [Actinomortierella wolfii]
MGGSAGSKRGGITSVSPGPGVNTGASGHIPGTYMGYEGNGTTGSGSKPTSGATVAPMEVSNSTASWTVGVQPRHGKGTSDPSSPYSSIKEAQAQKPHATSAFSSRSSFLRALGKFKNKHLQQRRPATSRPQTNTNSTQSSASRPLSFVLPPEMSSTGTTSDAPPIDTHQQSEDIDSKLAPPQANDLAYAPVRPEAERMPSHSSLATIGQDTISSVLEDKPAKSSLRLKLKNRVSHTLASIKSSSNLKEKARQQQQQQPPSSQNTSMTSATTSPPNQAEMGGKTSTVSDDTTTASGSGSLDKSKDKSLRHSRSFWSFPRVRLGDGGPNSTDNKARLDRPSLDQPAPAPVASTADNLPDPMSEAGTPPPTNAADEDVLMLSPEQGPAADRQIPDEDFDSDDSIDIITPLDYSDYTLYAELPLKKRKKLEAATKRSSLADLTPSSTGASSHRPHSMRASADAMRRFLQIQRQSGLRGRAGLSGTKKRVSLPAAEDYEGATLSQESTSSLVNENKKRGKRASTNNAAAADTRDDMDSMDEDDDDDVAAPSHAAAPSSTKAGGKKRDGDPSEWKNSLLRSLHFGRNMKKDQVIKIKPRPVNPSNTAPASSTQPSEEQDTTIVTSREIQPAAGPSVEPLPSGRVSRTNSVHSRSYSFASSTHPALMATSGMMTPRNRGPGLRRETLEMAMRRRRQSSAARSRYSDAGLPSPVAGARTSDFFNADNSSNANVTHTFTSFTLEFVDMHHAHDVMNKSVIPGLFNFKQRQQRLTISSAAGNSQPMETDHDFRGFDSDAVSGYTGDADISMESITVESRSIPPASGSSEGQIQIADDNSSSSVSKLDREKEKTARQFGFGGVMARRKISSVDGESDTISELPVLSIRTRDLGNNSKHGRVSRAPSGTHSTIPEDDNRATSPTKKRVGAVSPTLTRKSSRSVLRSSITSSDSRKNDATSGKSMTMDDVLKWEPQAYNKSTTSTTSSKTRPETNLRPLVIPKGSGDSNATTHMSSAGNKTPHSGVSTLSPDLSLSPSSVTPGSEAATTATPRVGRGIPSPLEIMHPSSSHVRQQSSLHEHQASHDAPLSAAAILPQHLKNFSTASTLSASSGYSAQTLTPGLHHYPSSSLAHSFTPLDRSNAMASTTSGTTTTSQAVSNGSGLVEFDPSADFPPTTPSDLKAMDFETLLQAAEREQQKGWEELKASKKLLKTMQDHQHQSRGGVAASQPLKHGRRPSQQLSMNNKAVSLNQYENTRRDDDDDVDDDDEEENRYRAPYHPKSALTAAVVAERTAIPSSTTNHPSSLRVSNGAPATSEVSSTPPLRPAFVQRQGSGQGSVVFDFDSSGVSDSGAGRGTGGYGTTGTTGSGSGSAGPNRTRRVMKQKKSVIRLVGQGSVQGRREDDGVIRVSKSIVSHPSVVTTHGRH